MSETKRFTPDNSRSMLAAVVWDSDGGWVRYKDHEAEMERLTSKRDAAQAEVERLTAERDTARAEAERLRGETQRAVEAEREACASLFDGPVWAYDYRKIAARIRARRLIAERDQPESRPKGREVGRFGLDGHYLDAMEPARPSDEDIWREAIMTLLPSYPVPKAAEHADGVLAEYRKRWPR